MQLAGEAFSETETTLFRLPFRSNKTPKTRLYLFELCFKQPTKSRKTEYGKQLPTLLELQA